MEDLTDMENSATQPVPGDSDADSQEPRESRKAQVGEWCDTVKKAKKHHAAAFTRMREDQDFVAGDQWPNDPDGENYVANICMRHQQNRVASLYAKRPTTVARVRQTIDTNVWDGTQQTLMMAAGAVMDPTIPAPPEAQAIVEEYQTATRVRAQKKKLARTLELLYDYNVDNQVIPFKSGMKTMVRRAVTTGVGYVKLGFVRAMQMKPEVTSQIAGLSERLRMLERLLSDFNSGDISENEAEMEQIRQQIAALQAEPQQVVREGLTFDYPRSTAIIPDTATQVLNGFVGASWVAEEYVLPVDLVEEIYGVNLGNNFTAYHVDAKNSTDESPVFIPDHVRHAVESDKKRAEGRACVWEIWSKRDGQVFVVCDGYPDYLQEPSEPDVWTERFWPWFALTPNTVDHDTQLYPPSDIRLIRHQQMELNRVRQGLREHRIANRPKTAVASGILTPSDVIKLETHPANAVLELQGLAPEQRIENVLQPIKMPGIDPNLYESNSVFEDVMRAVGVQEANLGPTSGGTATESSIAESSRMTSLSSVMDDMDSLLTEMARASGQILMAEISEQTVKKVAGDGAVWPKLTRAELAGEIMLEVEAGSSGRPNQAQEIQNAQQIFPLLLQIPGINPEFLARELLRRLDDTMRLDDAFVQNIPSVQAMNGAQGTGSVPGTAAAVSPGQNPAEQAAAGPSNAPAVPDSGPSQTEGQFPPPNPVQ